MAVAFMAHLVALATQCPKLLAQSPAGQEQSKPAPTPNRPVISVPNEQVISVLVFSTLLALNQANITGNYTVFRELGAPGFQAANSAAKLSEVFAALRDRGLDLSPILLFKLQLKDQPKIDDNGMLRVTGYFPTRPEHVNFDLLYQSVKGQWRLFGIAASTTPPAEAGAVTSLGAQPVKPAGQSQTSSAPTSKAVQPQPAKQTNSSTTETQKQDARPDIRDKIHELESSPNP